MKDAAFTPAEQAPVKKAPAPAPAPVETQPEE